MLLKLKELHENKNKVTLVQGVPIPKDFYNNGEVIEPESLKVNDEKIVKKFNALNKTSNGPKKSFGEKVKSIIVFSFQ